MAGRRRRDGRRRRWPWVVLVLLVVLVGAALLADVLLRREAERRASQRVGEVLEAPTDVRLHGTLSGLRLVTGRIPQVRITSTDVPLEGAPVSIDRLDLDLRDVRVGLDDLRGSNDELPAMDEGRFVARVGRETVEALIRAPRQIAGLSLVDGGVQLQVAGLALEAGARAVDGEVIFSPRGVLGLVGGRFVLDLSEQPGSPYVEEVETDPQSMVLRGRLEELDRAGMTTEGSG
jgi:hypothetical protein